MIPAEQLGKKFESVKTLWYSDKGVSLFVVTNFNGASAFVRFRIEYEGSVKYYQTHDTAVNRYNYLQRKIEAE